MVTNSPLSRSTRSRRRVTAAVATIALGCGVNAAAATTAAAVDTAPDNAAAAARTIAPAWLGEPVNVALVEGNQVAGAARASRVTYRSTGLNGSQVVVSGLLYTPQGTPPPGGWPVIAWAHGTTGVADACAPSLTKDAFGYGAYLSAWLSQGYAVAATDYEGLGTPGRHPYIIGDSEGRSVIDMVRAATRVDPSISNRYVAVGHSQGGQAALFAGKLDKTYGAGLDYRGTVAIAPGTRWKRLMENWNAFVPAAQVNPIVLLVLSGLNTARPAAFPYTELLTPVGRSLMDFAETKGCADSVGMLDGVTNEQVFQVDTGEANRIEAALNALAEPPIRGYGDPVLLVQGGKDVLVPADATQQTAAQMNAAGTTVDLKLYETADHMDVLPTSLPAVGAWVAGRMR